MALAWFGSHRWEVKDQLNCVVGLAAFMGADLSPERVHWPKRADLTKRKKTKQLHLVSMCDADRF